MGQFQHNLEIYKNWKLCKLFSLFQENLDAKSRFNNLIRLLDGNFLQGTLPKELGSMLSLKDL